ncbi:hypothetical protein [Prevotella pallens]|uniref:hypothetical protein n=1 Tax=Prevotella pallens TaxID=60133 RepID=UPI001CB53CD5|nr:hypothetical protein [Prevotella pallens]MBF1463373.1 hypothetical protein [Prevotella pallens]MBF1504431.1 hypothetical protein [Prevotella pallens]
MSGYGRDESAPTPDGVFVAHFTDCSLDISCVFVGLSHNYQSPFPTQVHKPTVYHFLFCCHFYHSSSAFNHLCIS